MSDRQLVTREIISAINPIPGADSIEAATVKGWTVVVGKGDFKPLDPVLYFEIDSFLPINDPRLAFLAPRGVREVDGVEGHVLKTVRLRGVYSQGLVLPLRDFPEAFGVDDVAERLGVFKYEPPVPANMTTKIKGKFPTQFARKTDAERVQNLTADYDFLVDNFHWIATEKLDGSSVTYINDGGELRVCSRNWEMKPGDSVQWRLAEELGILKLLRDGEVLQGEVYGEGIQKNPLKVKGQHFRAYSHLQGGVYVPFSQWSEDLFRLAVPLLGFTLPKTVSEAVEQVNGLKSQIGPGQAEGIVWHEAHAWTPASLDGRCVFKAINNKYLLKNGG